MDGYDQTLLTRQDMDNLFYAIDGALKVNRRFQFFLWAQGALQSLLPHESLICVRGDLDGMEYNYDIVTRLVLDDDFGDMLSDPIDGLLPLLLDLWRRNDRRIVASTAAGGDDRFSPQLRGVLARHGVQRLIAHGVRELRGDTGGFFVFLNGAAEFGLREAYLADLLLPHLHLAAHRLAAEEAADPEHSGVAAPASSVLSKREAQVLNWVREGKTNQEIAQILDISPLTVKNHVQKILRKLKVTNRAQAVARGIAARLIGERETAC